MPDGQAPEITQIIPPDVQHEGSDRPSALSRRILALRTAQLLAVGIITTKIPLLSALKAWRELGSSAFGNADSVEDIPTEIPPWLKAKPENNDKYIPADQIFANGLGMYTKWQPTLSLPNLHYTPPPNYLRNQDVAGNIVGDIVQDPGSLFNPPAIYEDALDILDANDQPYSMIDSASASNMGEISDLITKDPGTGLVKAITAAMNTDSFDVYKVCSNNALTDKQYVFIVKACRNWFDGAMRYVTDIQGGPSKKPISTSVLFGYFLRQNKGDILSSTWDTAVWLKLLARNNTETKSLVDFLRYDPTYERARQATTLFQDEFSRGVSANWVVKHVDPDDDVLNYVNPQDNNDPKNDKYKDYMPPNRAGGYYHVWNIIGLALSMDEALVSRTVASHINSWVMTRSHTSQYGKVKSDADMQAVDRASQIAALANRYFVPRS